MPRRVSPAAAAAVSRVLSGDGIQRAREYRKGIEFEGFWAEPMGDHVRVDYTPDFSVEPSDARPIVEEGLARCKSSLLRAHYHVSDAIEERYVYGGNPPMPMPVLEIRRAAWTRSAR